MADLLFSLRMLFWRVLNKGLVTMQSCRVAVADDDPRTLADLAACVTRGRHKVVLQAESTSDLARGCDGIALDLIIADVQMAGLDAISVAQQLSDQFDLPVIALADGFDDQLVESMHNSHVFAHLMKPIRDSDLLAAIPLAVSRYQELRALRTEAISMQQALDDRKLIERAKGILMRLQSLDEPSAFRHLQQMARSRRLKMSDIARSIVLAQEALESPASAKAHSAIVPAHANPLRRRAQ